MLVFYPCNKEINFAFHLLRQIKSPFYLGLLNVKLEAEVEMNDKLRTILKNRAFCESVLVANSQSSDGCNGYYRSIARALVEGEEVAENEQEEASSGSEQEETADDADDKETAEETDDEEDEEHGHVNLVHTFLSRVTDFA